ncbi:alpha/beta fold hydrolase [Actinomadura sp. ATCC 39365]
MPTVIHDGGHVHFNRAGSGPGLVMVHGTGGDAATNYGHLVQNFTDIRTVITPDYAGSGETADPGGDLTLDLLIEQVAATFPEGGPSDLVGFSLGAVVAAGIAARYPERVRRLVLIAGWTHADDPRLRLGLRTWARLAATDPESFAAYGPLVGFSPAFVSGLGEDGLKAMMAGDPPPGRYARSSWTSGPTSGTCSRASPRPRWSSAARRTTSSRSGTPAPCTPRCPAAVTPSWTAGMWCYTNVPKR